MLLMNTAIDAFLAISWPLFVTGTWSKKEPTKGSATDTSLAVMPKSTAIWLKVDEVEYSAVQLKVTLDENSTELITVGWSSGYITTLNSRAPARDDALTEVTMVVAVVPSVTTWVSYTLQVLVTESYRPTSHQRVCLRNKNVDTYVDKHFQVRSKEYCQGVRDAGHKLDHSSSQYGGRMFNKIECWSKERESVESVGNDDRWTCNLHPQVAISNIPW